MLAKLQPSRNRRLGHQQLAQSRLTRLWPFVLLLSRREEQFNSSSLELAAGDVPALGPTRASTLVGWA